MPFSLSVVLKNIFLYLYNIVTANCSAINEADIWKLTLAAIKGLDSKGNSDSKHYDQAISHQSKLEQLLKRNFFIN